MNLLWRSYYNILNIFTSIFGKIEQLKSASLLNHILLERDTRVLLFMHACKYSIVQRNKYCCERIRLRDSSITSVDLVYCVVMKNQALLCSSTQSSQNNIMHKLSIIFMQIIQNNSFNYQSATNYNWCDGITYKDAFTKIHCNSNHPHR